MSNYSKFSSSSDARLELHDKMGLTGSEISLNNLPAGASVPFVHAHKKNEEVYYIISGKGRFEIDGDKVELNAGDFIRISPAGKRQLFADANSPISYICIQTKEKSLEEFTGSDAVMC